MINYLKLFNDDKMQIFNIDLMNDDTELLVDIRPSFKLNEVMDIPKEEAEKMDLIFNVHILPKEKHGWIEGDNLNGDIDDFYMDPTSPLYDLTPIELNKELYNTVINEMKHWDFPVGFNEVMTVVDTLEPIQ